MTVTYTDKDGRESKLSGRARGRSGNQKPPRSWVDREHPLRPVWVKAEARQRASYIGTREALVPFLVPHRFEGGSEADPSKLNRAGLGYGMRLNQSYLQEILGHIRSAPARYNWGPMGEGGEKDAEVLDRPAGGLAQKLWDDATREGVPWRIFWERDVLEWMLSSPGALVLVDNVAGKALTQQDEERLGKRPYLKLLPFSWVEDHGRGATGFRYVRLAEIEDNRQPKDTEEKGLEERHVLYELLEGGVTEAARYDEDGEPLGEIKSLDRFLDPQGNPILPLAEARYGTHPEIPYLGSGLLMGLDDVIIDLFNLVSEVREAYRDAAFSMTVHQGPDYEAVKEALTAGSRMVGLGDNPGSTLQRVAGDATEVDAGLRLIEMGLRAWAEAARRNASEAVERATAKSGIALQAEFQLDLRPLLVEVAEALDAVETNAMYLAGQMAGYSPDQLQDVGVTRETTFQLEDEASRIARLVSEYVQSLDLPPAALERIALKWLEATDLLDMDEEVELGDAAGEGSEKVTLRDLLRSQLEELAENRRRQTAQASGFQPFNTLFGEPEDGGEGEEGAEG